MCLDKLKELYPCKEDCFENKTSATEKGKIFRIECEDRTEQFCRIHVDGCFVIDNNSSKCDYIFVRCKNEDVYYVELKGQDIDKAYEQIVRTLQQHYKTEKSKIYGFIVTGKGIPNNNAKRRKMEEEFVKKHGVRLKFEKSPCIHKI